MTPISVVIITYNEEVNIGRCLDSVLPVADEIVVVDSFSKDRTVEICEKKGARVIQHIFDGHIEQKNRAIDHATYPHILSLDADEVLSENLQQSVIKAKENWMFDGYYCNRLNNYCGKWIRHCGWYPDRKLRLWDSGKGRWAGTNPHDRFEMIEGSKTSTLKGDLLHFTFSSVKQHMDQINLFSDIKAKMAFEKGKRAGLFHLLFLPWFRFIRGYILKLGFLDGFYGYVICRNSAHGEFLRYVKLRRMRKTKLDIL